MMSQSNLTPNSGKILYYQIKLEGHLDQRWASWFDEMDITHRKSGNTILSGPIRDQAELQGLIKKIYSLGLTLISVNPLNGDQER